MKIMNGIFLALILFCSMSLTLADSLHGIAKEYDVLENMINPPKDYEINKPLPNSFHSGKYSMAFEKTTINDLKSYFGGSIKKDNSEIWVCYNSDSEGITYWFLSFMEMQHGDLSTVILAPLDKKSKCDVPLHAINLKMNFKIPLLHSTHAQIFNFFNLKVNKKPSILTVSNSTKIHDTYFKEDSDKLNIISYFFKKDKTIGIFISQVTTN